MRLVRYIGLIYAGATMLTIIGLVVIVVGASLVEGSGTMMRANAGAGAVLEIAGYRAAGFAYQIMPAAVLLGAMIAGTTLARRGELLGAQASGIGPSRIWVAFVGGALLFTVLTAIAGEYIVPWSIVRLEREQIAALGRSDSASTFYNRPVQWFRKGDLILYLPEVDLARQRFNRPVIYRMTQGELTSVMEAKTLLYGPDGFHLQEARVLDVATSTFTHAPDMPLPLDATPAALADVTGDPRQMRIVQVAELARRRSAAGFDATPHALELHGRLSHPLNAIWLALVCAPWALHVDRRRSLAVNLGIGVIAIAVLLTLMYSFRMLALGHQIAAPLGAWGLSLTILAAMPVSFWSYRKLRAA
jgi:lipopolysaccharide export system permease protein